MKGKVFEMIVRMHMGFTNIKSRWGTFLKGEKGSTSVEYALITGVIVLGIVAAASIMFQPLQDFFESVIEYVQSVLDDNQPSFN